MADLLAFPPLDAVLQEEGAQQGRSAFHSMTPDAEARRDALDISRSWIVEAPAGSGKTGLLMQRLLKLLAFGRIAHPEEVLAITFTRKATAELRDRLLQELMSAAKGDALSPHTDSFRFETRAFAEAVLRRDGESGWGVLQHPERLNVRTIDSVCGDIARSLPVLSGSGGGQEPIEDAGELHRTAAARTLAQLGGNDRALDDALGTVLLHRDGDLANCTSLIARMLQTREQWGRLLPLSADALTEEVLEQDVRPKLERALEEVVCSALTRASQQVPRDLLEELAAIGARSALLPGYKGRTAPFAACAGRGLAPGSRASDLDHWVALSHVLFTKDGWRKSFHGQHFGVSVDPEELTRLQSLASAHTGDEDLREAFCALRALPPAGYPDEQWRVVKALFRVLRHALVELKLLFAERGQCDFAELSLAARQVLNTAEGPADFAEATGLGLRHILVDEVQDTSTAQYDLLEKLLQSWGGEGETVFLVGDPKQSIYLFRQARVERFLRTFREGHLGDFPLGRLRLTANFRTQSSLVSGFNQAFAAIFPTASACEGAPAENPGDVPFVAALATRPRTTQAGLRWHAGILDEAADPGELRMATRQHTLEQARAIRQIVHQWQARPLPPGRRHPWRIAILARHREHLEPIVAEFNRKIDGLPLPYRAVDIDALASRQEILDLLALTRALLHPADRVAWLAVLHAPWCGLGRADLLALTGEGPGSDARASIPSLVALRSSHLSTDGQAHLARCWPVLAEALRSLGRTSLSVHLERTWRSLGGDAPLPDDGLSNARAFFRALRQVEAEDSGRVDLSRLAARLGRLYAEPRAAIGAVELLTMHKSKGLEWDVVLVPGLERRPPAASVELLNWVELEAGSAEAAHVLLAPIYGKGEDSDKLNKWLRSVRRGRELAEGKRLFYVASTRAREELHLFGACVRKQDGSLTLPWEGSLLRAAWPAAASLFEQAPVAAPLHDVPTKNAGPLAARSGGAENAASLEFHAAPLLFPSWTSAPHEEKEEEVEASEGLALAASAAEEEVTATPALRSAPPQIHRLPLSFLPLDRFKREPWQRLPYEPSAAVRTSTFERPEGSFAARAFGNVVHRFLGQMSALLGAGASPEGVSAEVLSRAIQGWEPRLLASLRAEGLAPALAVREAARVKRALLQTLEHEQGRWLLAPHPGAADECSLTPADAAVGGLRVDRMFLAGNAPLLDGENTIWIIDFKTTEPGGRNQDDFLREERSKYRAQLEAYATVRRSLPGGQLPIRLALYYPLVPSLLHWESEVIRALPERA